MKIKIYQVDAFTSEIFRGNPAAVCPLDKWLDDDLLQSIAMENNLSETAFFVPYEKGYQLRWFTPTTEVDLCGHATLATGFVLYEILNYEKPSISFKTRSGELIVAREGDLLQMDFPALPLKPCPVPEALSAGLDREPMEVLVAEDYLVVYQNEQIIRTLTPDFRALKALDKRGVIVTAPGREVDFVSRFFAPGSGIDEDPVTGSAHCELAPYWSEKLRKTRLQAHQLSQRGGEVICQVKGDRILLFGAATLFMEGEIRL